MINIKYTLLFPFVLLNGAAAATIQDYNDGKATLPLSFNVDSTDAVACIVTTYPRPFPSHLSVFGHMSLMVQHRNGTLETASLTGKVGQPTDCMQDNLLVNRKCKFHKDLEVTLNKCEFINDPTLAELSTLFRETQTDSFQNEYSLLNWNCVIWTTQTWNLIGLPNIDYHLFPIPHLVW